MEIAAKRDNIEVVAIQIGETLYFDKRPLTEWFNSRFAPSGLKFRFVSRDVFKFMEACDIWREREFSEMPALFTFTQEQWQEAHKKGLAHG
jgi:hypothetical protein